MPPPDTPRRWATPKRKRPVEVPQVDMPMPMEWQTSHAYKRVSDVRNPRVISKNWVNTSKKRDRQGQMISRAGNHISCTCLMPGNSNQICEQVAKLMHTDGFGNELIESRAETIELDLSMDTEKNVRFQLVLHFVALGDIVVVQ